MKRVIREEVASIQSQIPQKIDILNQMIEALDQRKVLSGVSVAIISTGYRRFGPEIYSHLSRRERNCLHVIYERLRVADGEMTNFESSVVTAVREKQLARPYKVYASRLSELKVSYHVVQDLARSYLSGDPKDVFPDSA